MAWKLTVSLNLPPCILPTVVIFQHEFRKICCILVILLIKAEVEQSVITFSLQEEHRTDILEQVRLYALENIDSVGRSGLSLTRNSLISLFLYFKMSDMIVRVEIHYNTP